MTPDSTQSYFDALESDLERAVKIASEARLRGCDPETYPEIPMAKDLADRVENLIGIPVADRIRELAYDLKMSREESAMQLGADIAGMRIHAFESRDEAVEMAIRAAVALLTEGVVAAPIEGIAKITVEKNDDGTEFIRIFYAGPVRSAGGTAQALSVLVADYVRRELGINRYIPRTEEIERCVEEITKYRTVANLQYTPSDEEVRLITTNCPICIDGEPTEEEEVEGYRNLARIETNRVRGGMALVIAEGMALKAPKILKHVAKLHLDGWDFLNRLVTKGASDDSGSTVIEPKGKYLNDLIAGRPVFSHPSMPGGFRLRYGRARNTGFAAAGVSPATMIVTDSFLATGTQTRVERPGKAAGISPVNGIEGPTVRLFSGEVLRIDDEEDAVRLHDMVEEILDVGEILINYGDFLENNHPLMPPSYSFEWWISELKELAGTEAVDEMAAGDLEDPDQELALELCDRYGVPLHPKFTYLWHDISIGDFRTLSKHISLHGRIDDGILLIPNDSEVKRILETILLPHRVVDGESEIAILDPLPLMRCTGAGIGDGGLQDAGVDDPEDTNVLEAIFKISGIRVRPRAPTRIGARMGRPEKSDKREMKPAPHVLFPVGETGGKSRLLTKAANYTRSLNAGIGVIPVEIGMRRCPSCGNETYEYSCGCGARTEPVLFCKRCNIHVESCICPKCGLETTSARKIDLDLKTRYASAFANLGERDNIPIFKGVQGMISKDKSPESLEKGILRAKHRVFVFKDGTVRYDLTDLPLTQFSAEEIGVDLDTLKRIGYEYDTGGLPLTDKSQILDLRVQDIILSIDAGEYLLRVSRFIDDLLVKYYGGEAYYNASKRNDLIGRLVIGLAPHTSAGVLGRLIGFTRASVGYAHPFFHAAKRRNCLSPDTDVLVLNSKKPVFSRLEDIYDSAESPEEIIDDFGTVQKLVQGVETYAMDPENGRFEVKKVKSVIKTPAPSNLVKLTSKSGRVFVASPEHRMMVRSSEGEFEFKKMLELSKSDRLLLPKRIDIVEHDSKEIDLLMEFLRIDRSSEEIMVREVRPCTEKCIDDLGGLKSAAQKMSMGKKILSNYLYRDSIPLHTLKSLLDSSGNGWDLIEGCKLGVKRDHTTVPRIIKIDDSFMRLLGYYLAEGYARSRDRSFYQIGLSSMEDDILKDMEQCITDVFGIVPGRSDHVLTISGRLVYRLFTEILGTGKGARDKRIPSGFVSLPLNKIKHLLSAYFAGDGSAREDRLHVTCSSVSRRLLQDIGLQLLRFGIFYRLKHERRPAGGAAKEFYAKLGELPLFDLYYISIRSSYARRFSEEIGFASVRKEAALNSVLLKEGTPRSSTYGDTILDEIKTVEPDRAEADYLYDIEVEDHHNFLINDFMVSANCDGDEDCVMLLMDGLLNFSRSYLPARRGGWMDAPLVLTTRIDP
ncbi:MAG: DNA polymerase II large subunit, partial [Euryarchaeota archaeon]|nr:DNA polymerase II large subunit [Euryarchaeota archaeon]